MTPPYKGAGGLIDFLLAKPSAAGRAQRRKEMLVYLPQAG